MGEMGTLFPRPLRWQNLDRQGVDAVLQLGVEHIHDGAVLRHAAHAIKMVGRDSDTKVGFTTLPPSGVTEMLVRFIDHMEESGGELSGELGFDGVCGTHGGEAFYLVQARN